MGSPSIGLMQLRCAGLCLSWATSGRRGAPRRADGTPKGVDGAEWAAQDTPASWVARHLTRWERLLQPLRPLDAPVARATAREASWPLRQDLTSAGWSRRLVTGRLGEWGLGELADTAELLVSELVTNALRHARGPVRLNLSVCEGRLRCEVEDTNDAGPVRRTVPLDAEGGRGIELLDMLSEAWGSFRTATGKTTWFELAVPVQWPGAMDPQTELPRAAGGRRRGRGGSGVPPAGQLVSWYRLFPVSQSPSPRQISTIACCSWPSSHARALGSRVRVSVDANTA